MPKRIVEELLAAYKDLTRFLARRLGDPQDAADVTQESFERVLAHAASAEIRSPRGLLFRVATNLAIDHNRRSRILPTVPEPTTFLTRAPDPKPTPETVLLTRGELTILQQAIDELPPRCREVFVLARVEGLTYREIGERLNISPKTAFSHVVKALGHLKLRMEQAQENQRSEK